MATGGLGSWWGGWFTAQARRAGWALGGQQGRGELGRAAVQWLGLAGARPGWWAGWTGRLQLLMALPVSCVFVNVECSQAHGAAFFTRPWGHRCCPLPHCDGRMHWVLIERRRRPIQAGTQFLPFTFRLV